MNRDNVSIISSATAIFKFLLRPLMSGYDTYQSYFLAVLSKEIITEFIPKLCTVITQRNAGFAVLQGK